MGVAIMKVYDFDDTIFLGDSTRAFYFYCLKQQPMLLRYLPKQLFGAGLYIVKAIPKTRFKEYFFSFLRGIPDVEELLESFWQSHFERIQSWYRDQCAPEDLVISASPEFLLAPACRMLSIQPPIASRVDKNTGLYTGKNCKGKEKVLRYRSVFGETMIEEFYSDSLSDAPLAELAVRSFLVKAGTINPWPDCSSLAESI